MTVREKGGPTEVLYARVAQGTTAKFKNAMPRGFRQGDCMTAAIELWAELPEDVRIDKLIGRLDSTLEKLIDKVLQRKLAKGMAAGKWEIRTRKQTRRRAR